MWVESYKDVKISCKPAVDLSEFVLLYRFYANTVFFWSPVYIIMFVEP